MPFSWASVVPDLPSSAPSFWVRFWVKPQVWERPSCTEGRLSAWDADVQSPHLGAAPPGVHTAMYVPQPRRIHGLTIPCLPPATCLATPQVSFTHIHRHAHRHTACVSVCERETAREASLQQPGRSQNTQAPSPCLDICAEQDHQMWPRSPPEVQDSTTGEVALCRRLTAISTSEAAASLAAPPRSRPATQYMSSFL